MISEAHQCPRAALADHARVAAAARGRLPGGPGSCLRHLSVTAIVTCRSCARAGACRIDSESPRVRWSPGVRRTPCHSGWHSRRRGNPGPGPEPAVLC